MDQPTPDELRDLIRRGTEPCVSVFLPTHRAGPGIDEDRIRFKNLVRTSEARLVELGLRKPDVDAILTPARSLLDDGLFWERQADGLAVFACDGYFGYYRVPITLNELAIVAGRFHVKPLLPLLEGGAEFYVLALSKNNVGLFRQTRFSVQQMQLPGAPKGLADAIKYEQPERQLQFRTATSARGGRQALQFHGHGGKEEDAKDVLLAYFRQVDESVRKALSGDHAPLVMAGVDYLFPIYREANTYPHLLDAGVPGNPDEESPQQIHQRRAWEVVRSRFEAARRHAAERYDSLARGPHASSKTEEIVAAALLGRVETLFVAVDAERWGRVDPGTSEVVWHDELKAGDEDLLDVAAGETLLHGGTVYAVASADVPGGALAAAIYRY